LGSALTLVTADRGGKPRPRQQAVDLSSTPPGGLARIARVRSLIVPLLFGSVLVSGCALFGPERRLAEADLTYHPGKLVVLPVMLPFHTCPGDIDRRARSVDVMVSLTTTVSNNLRARGYAVLPLLLDPDLLDPKSPPNRDLARALCDGSTLTALPPSVAAFAAQIAGPLGADQVLVSGVARLRWHLKLDTSDPTGSVSEDTANQFQLRAVGALYDLAQKRVVWSDFADTQVLTGDYQDAIHQVMRFDALHHSDPHQRLFYDFPPPAGAKQP